MILIADSGSSKTQWIILENRSIIDEFETVGLNPFYIDEEDVVSTVEPFASKYSNLIKDVYFYGAGCSGGNPNLIIENGIKKVLPQANTLVNSDILGAARAVIGNDTGLTVILGTGQSTCFYSKGEIVYRLPSLGFILGDDGSGASLGLDLLKTYLKGKFPHDLSQDLSEKYSLNPDVVKNEVYKGKTPNQFLASFSRYILEKKDHSFIKQLISANFNRLFDDYIMKYPESKDYPIGFVGSIAFYFQDNLRIIAKERKIQIGNIIQYPIKELVKYHSNQLK